MKRSTVIVTAGIFFLSGMFAPSEGFCKKGGIGNGGGYSEDGTLYHSHSDRSYSGRDTFKGKGKAKGRNKTKTKGNSGKSKGKGNKKSQNTVGSS